MTDRLALWRRFAAETVSAAGVTLDLSRVRFPEGYLEREARKALEFLRDLEGGAIANPKQKRRVGHYWLRAPWLAPTHEIRSDIETTIERVKRLAARVHAGEVRPQRAERFRSLVVAGIGGSALGPQLAADALGSRRDRMRPFFLDNTDPDGFDRVLGALRDGTAGRLEETLVLVISKSGETQETRNAMLEARAAYRAAGLDFASHAAAVTGPGSELDATAAGEGWLERFPMWDWVGGRTSETSAVGLLPAALQGIDIDELLRGAREMDEATRSDDPRRNIAMLLALAWHHATGGRGQKDMVILPYKDRLALLPRYLQQLVMESLGKELDLDGQPVHQGIAVYGNKGSTDQHSYVQQLRDGVHNFFVTFIEVLRDREGESVEVEPGVTSGDYLLGFLLGTREALHEKGRESITLTLEAVTPRSLGALIALHERAVGLYARLVNLNAYDQPGVEAGKTAAARVIEVQGLALQVLRAAKGELLTAETIAARAGVPEETETVYKVLEHLAANGRGVRAQPGPGPEQGPAARLYGTA